MNEPSCPGTNERRNTLRWVQASIGAVGISTGTGGALSALHNVHASPSVTIALCALSAVSVLASIAVPIVEVRTRRPATDRQAEAHANRLKHVAPEKAVIYGMIDKVVTAKGFTPEDRKQCLDMLGQCLADAAEGTPSKSGGPPGPTVIPGGREFTGDGLTPVANSFDHAGYTPKANPRCASERRLARLAGRIAAIDPARSGRYEVHAAAWAIEGHCALVAAGSMSPRPM